MREVHVFYAYDDKEFFDREECLAYEREALLSAWEIDGAYAFFDKDMNRILAPRDTKNIDDWINWLGIVGDSCVYVRRNANLSSKTEMFYREQWGYCILNEDFNNELGLFRYDWNKDIWIKVGE